MFPALMIVAARRGIDLYSSRPVLLLWLLPFAGKEALRRPVEFPWQRGFCGENVGVSGT